jgi:osmotically-inducible protein OsmY
LTQINAETWARRDSSSHRHREEAADGVVHLWGTIQSEEERKATIAAAENVPGIKKVEDHMSFPVYPGLRDLHFHPREP